MNEGKPTKAKWWSRPRAHGAGAGTTGDDTGLTGTTGVPVDAVRAESGGGDFELERPATVPAPAEADTDHDFELARPATESAARTGTTPGAGPDGDFELERPDGVFALERPAPAAGHGAETRTAEGSTSASGEATTRLGLEKPAPEKSTPVAATVVADAPPSAEPGALEASEAPSERPKPLHAPDPYSTPPYGEPGPWAPAPPVQHPATTPAHGTNVQAGPPAHAVPAAVGAGTAHSVAAPAYAEATPAAAAPSPVPPAHDTAVTPATRQPATAALYPDAPQPGAAPYPDSSQQPPGASYAYPSQPAPPPYGDASHPAPSPASYADARQPTSPAYADPSQPPYADAAPGVPQGPHGPWRNYDPWAGSGSLQQNGAGTADVSRQPRRRGKTLLVGALLLTLVSGGVGGAVGAYVERNGGVGEVELPQSDGGVTGRAPDSVAGIAASALPGVVTLHVSGTDAQGTGTGFVLDERGHILTNNHVVEPAGTSGDISVTFSGGETAKATIVGRDTGYDLAVVKVSDVSGLKPLPLGNSDDVQVGDPVVAIGAPFDLANTVTSGIISAKERPITAGGESGDVSDVSYVDALQTDAPINPGNSGGPLLDGKARVIGINSAIRSAGSGSESDGGQAGSIGLGFAIPINQGKRVAEELINTGKASHPVIGVSLDMDYTGDGARIGDEGSSGGSAVTEGGPADRAGLRSGDVITEVDGQRVHSGEELIVKVRAHRSGDRLELTLQRGGKEQTVTLTLGSSDGG
ncbi:S1C family serine protease [Streptomyces adelaidensis]|uniref:S1C family serine protease n=1 Tax=Streptomyces adelaidensis TaxID=2796465 RepID=UPI001906FD53|nr:trypsin-like peptidase domain-containing protein [Streptomyces adelaidensis]